jgi:hypothetical protein
MDVDNARRTVARRQESDRCHLPGGHSQIVDRPRSASEGERVGGVWATLVHAETVETNAQPGSHRFRTGLLPAPEPRERFALGDRRETAQFRALGWGRAAQDHPGGHGRNRDGFDIHADKSRAGDSGT